VDELSRFQNRVGLLVSVRDAAEAELALAGGADVIDIKEPHRGSLGAADANVIASVVAMVAGRAPISVAAGELVDWPPRDFRSLAAGFAPGASFIKFGLAGCSAISDWQARWQGTCESCLGTASPVAVVYADWTSAAAPAPDEILSQARLFGCQALLVDTWDKSSGDLFGHWPASQLADFGSQVRSAGMHLVLAGSLQIAALPLALRCQPSLIAVRGAVCEGDRRDRISLQRVQALRAALEAASYTSRGGPVHEFAV
jgi:uncharacterized protein (UPF0264 family)